MKKGAKGGLSAKDKKEKFLKELNEKVDKLIKEH